MQTRNPALHKTRVLTEGAHFHTLDSALHSRTRSPEVKELSPTARIVCLSTCPTEFTAVVGLQMYYRCNTKDPVLMLPKPEK